MLSTFGNNLFISCYLWIHLSTIQHKHNPCAQTATVCASQANPLYLLGNNRESHQPSEVGLAWHVNINKTAPGSTSSVFGARTQSNMHTSHHTTVTSPRWIRKVQEMNAARGEKKLRNSASSCFSSWKLLNHQQLLTDWVVNLSLCSGWLALCWGGCGDVWSRSPGRQQTHARNATAWLSRANLCKLQRHFASTLASLHSCSELRCKADDEDPQWPGKAVQSKAHKKKTHSEK